jgi:hypothetical protein
MTKHVLAVGRNSWSMIPKSGNRFSDKIMLKQIETTIQCDRIAVECNASLRRG